MPHFQHKSTHIMGFTAETTQPGQEVVKILSKVPVVTSDDPNFHTWINHIYNIFFAPHKIISSRVNDFLVLLRSDDTVDIYINDFKQAKRVKVNRTIQAGEAVFGNDILDITDIQFPDIEINTTDAVIYSCRFNWKFGLYFDFSRELDLEKLSNELAELHKHIEFQHLIDATNAEIKKTSAPIMVVTEGKTDWEHMEHAKERLKIETDIAFDKTPDERGDTSTLQMCKHFSRMDNGKVIIFIFDNDNPATLKQLEPKTVSGKEFQDWGNNVYSFALPVPDHRKNYKNISIEFYYTDDEIRTKDKDGKRLFFDNELELRKAPGESAVMVEVAPVTKTENEKKIYDQDVTKILDANRKQVALSKSNFAQNIIVRIAGFDKFDVKEFNKIFAVIQNIADYSTKQKSK